MHLESDLANIAEAQPRRPARSKHVPAQASPSASIRELRREQQMLRQQDQLHKLEWEINRKQDQVRACENNLRGHPPLN